MGKLIDMTGWVMKEHGVSESLLTVIEKDKQKSGQHDTFWICKCECGNIKSYPSGRIRNGKVKSCGCYKTKYWTIDMTGWIMQEHGVEDSHLTVINKDEELTKKKHEAFWRCKCSCGEIKSYPGYKIRSGLIKHCEKCNNHNFIDMTGWKMWEHGIQDSKLTVIKRVENNYYNKNYGTMWLCECNCKNHSQIITTGYSLRAGLTKSCGCLRSNGENYIVKILEQNNLKYLREYTFPDLLSEKNAKLRFDFAIFNEKNELLFLLEYDGKQHFEEAFGSWEETLQEIQAKDQNKNLYCKKNNIILKRIPYTEKLNFNIEDIFGDKYNI